MHENIPAMKHLKWLLPLLTAYAIPCASATWLNGYLGTSIGNLSRNQTAQQIKLAQHAALLSDSYNASIDRGLIYKPQWWGQHWQWRLDSYSTLETSQHGSAVALDKLNIMRDYTASIGMAGLYQSQEKYGFTQANMNIMKHSGNTHISTTINIPLKRR